jgi:hypothetical protein
MDSLSNFAASFSTVGIILVGLLAAIIGAVWLARAIARRKL